MADIDLSNVNRLYTILLLNEEAKHGYQIIKDIEAITGDKPTTSHIYPFLNTLDEQGLVTTETTGGRGKTTYTLTDDGRELVNEQLDKFATILTTAIKGEITTCVHCGCKVYQDGYKHDGKTYCCKHCAHHHEAHPSD